MPVPLSEDALCCVGAFTVNFMGSLLLCYLPQSLLVVVNF